MPNTLAAMLPYVPASQISDAARRQAFWADVPAHRALLAASAAQEGKC